MKPIHFVLACLLVIAGITGYVLTSEPTVPVTGVPHATITGMNMGGDGAARLEAIGRAPFYFQVFVILLAVGLLYMGVPAHRRDGRFRLFMALGGAFALFVWWQLYGSYEAYHIAGTSPVVFGFPVPTNWMLWGIWGSFALFDIFFVIFFRQYFLHPEDEAAFEALVAEMKTSQSEGDA